jgi:predicted transcriptional regulator
MPARRPKRPTDAELVILRVLWTHGPCTVRQVNRILNEARPTGYTTTLKQMQVMTGKGLLVRDESCRPQVYRPAFSQDQTQKQLVAHLMDGAFGGSARKLVLQALRARDVSPEELARIERLLDKLEGDQT